MPQPFWSQKPWWCQPWSILLCGSIAIAASWLLLQLWWVTIPVAMLVVAWWVLFLIVVPFTTPKES
jgi:hypothetical protein